MMGMSFRFFFGPLFIFVFGRMVGYYVETYILHPILQSAFFQHSANNPLKEGYLACLKTCGFSSANDHKHGVWIHRCLTTKLEGYG